MEPLMRLGFPVHGCDPRPDAVDATRERIEDLVGKEDAENCVRVADLSNMQYPDASFDWVIAYHAEALATTTDELHTLLSEARRMLKPGGWVYLTFPAAASDINEQDRTAGDGASVDLSHSAEEGQAASGVFSIDVLTQEREAANLAVASTPEIADEHGERRLRAIFRRVDPETPR
jgi:SAM-dependent methyltransferase